MCSGFLNQEAIGTIVAGSSSPQIIKNALENYLRGVTMFLDPTETPLSSFTIENDTNAQTHTDFLQMLRIFSTRIWSLNGALKGSSIMLLLVGIRDRIFSNSKSTDPGIALLSSLKALGWRDRSSWCILQSFWQGAVLACILVLLDDPLSRVLHVICERHYSFITYQPLRRLVGSQPLLESLLFFLILTTRCGNATEVISRT